MCYTDWLKTAESKNVNLDGDPPLELQFSVRNIVLEFSVKQDSGKISECGLSDNLYKTEWSVIGGPIIGFQFKRL